VKQPADGSSQKVKELPIILSADNVRALFDPVYPKTEARSVSRDRRRILSSRRIQRRRKVLGHQLALPSLARRPYGDGGIVLWVREPFCVVHDKVFYLSDPQTDPRVAAGKPKPGVLMPKRYARIRLVVTETLEQHLNSISEAEALSEGTLAKGKRWLAMGFPAFLIRAAELYPDSLAHLSDGAIARTAFSVAWDLLASNRRFPWNSNPNVIVTRFRLLETPASPKTRKLSEATPF
jgi:hypothetical protein